MPHGSSGLLQFRQPTKIEINELLHQPYVLDRSNYEYWNTMTTWDCLWDLRVRGRAKLLVSVPDYLASAREIREQDSITC